MKKYVKKCAVPLLSAIVATLLCCCVLRTMPVNNESTEPITQETTHTLETVQPNTETSTVPLEPIYVYENAIEDYMLPIDEHSWDREYAPEFVMLHFSSAIISHPEDPYNVQFVRETFLECDVSIHYVVERDGTVRCYIPEDRVAWHAGAGEWGNLDKYTNKMNYYAIGIEVLAIGSEEDMSIFMTNDKYGTIDESLIGYTQEQYDALKLIIADICDRYDIPMNRAHVIGHEEYSDKKTDPGELFDWAQIIPGNNVNDDTSKNHYFHFQAKVDFLFFLKSEKCEKRCPKQVEKCENERKESGLWTRLFAY
jgi:N-acetylmuramoyl-L-alanine amidase